MPADPNQMKAVLQEIIKAYDLLVSAEIQGDHSVEEKARDLLRANIERARIAVK